MLDYQSLDQTHRALHSSFHTPKFIHLKAYTMLIHHCTRDSIQFYSQTTTQNITSSFIPMSPMMSHVFATGDVCGLRNICVKDGQHTLDVCGCLRNTTLQWAHVAYGALLLRISLYLEAVCKIQAQKKYPEIPLSFSARHLTLFVRSPTRWFR